MLEVGDRRGDFVVTEIAVRMPNATMAYATQSVTERRVLMYALDPSKRSVLAAVKLRARVDDSRLLDVLAAGETPSPWVVFEAPRGESLEDLVRKSGSITVWTPPLLGICDALASIHRAGGVHGCLRPSAIWIESDGRIKLGELGLHGVVGDPAWTSIEEPQSPASDVAALARIVWFALVGQPPPAAAAVAATPASAIARSMNAPIALTPTFDAWFERCTRADASLRFASAGDAREPLAYALESLVSRPAVIAPPVAHPYRGSGQPALVTPRRKPSHGVRVMPVMLIILGVVAGFLVVGHLRRHPEVNPLHVVHREGPPPSVSIPAHMGAVFGVATTDALVLSSSFDDTVKAWDPETGHQRFVVSPNFGHGGGLDVVQHTFAAGGAAGVVKIWQIDDGGKAAMLVKEIPAHKAQVTSVALSADAKRLATASFDGTVRVWSLPSGEPVAVHRGHVGRVLTVAFAPEGDRVLSAGDDGTLRIWSERGAAPRVFVVHKKAISKLAIAADGQTIATASDDGTVVLTHADTGAVLRTLTVASTEVWSLAFTPSGRTLATGDRDGVIQLYSVFSGEHLQTLPGNTRGTLSLAFSPDGHTLWSSGGDGCIRAWKNL